MSLGDRLSKGLADKSVAIKHNDLPFGVVPSRLLCAGCDELIQPNETVFFIEGRAYHGEHQPPRRIG